MPSPAAVAPIFEASLATAAKPAFASGAAPAIMAFPAGQALRGLRGEFSSPTLILMAAVGLVLLTACANVAGLLLARNASRGRELAIRRALGADRARIARQLLTESLLLSLAGGVVGIAVAVAGSRLLVTFLETGPFGPTGLEATFSLRILMFVLAASVATGLLFGAAPAWRSGREDLTGSLKQVSGTAVPSTGHAFTPGARTIRRGGPGRVLVVAQVAASMLLLVVAGLLVRTLVNLEGVDPGFDTGNVLLFGINPASGGYTPQRSLAVLPELKHQLEEIPGVTSVTYSSSALLGGGVSRTMIKRPEDATRSLEVDSMDVGPGFFETMAIPFVAGHGFLPTDFHPRPAVMVVNRAFLRQFFGRDDAGRELGKYPRVLDREIVGVVGDVKATTLRGEAAPTMYRPLVFSFGPVRYALRTAGRQAHIAAAVRQTVTNVDSSLPVLNLQSQEDVIARLLFRERLYARAGSLFSLSAVLLVGIGLHGLLAYGVAQRTREIGIRMALGAEPSGVVRMVVGDALALTAVGILIGTALALAVGRLFSSVVFGVGASDPLTIGLALTLLLIVSMAAALLPALRASRVDPLVALRQE